MTDRAGEPVTTDGGRSLVIVIGRGHSGTRVLSHTLIGSGVYMGKWLNGAGDKIPGDQIYEACRMLGRHVRLNGSLSWDFTSLDSMPIEREFISLIDTYLDDVLTAPRKRRGWKLPETNLVYPWIVRLFPLAAYVYIVRDPRDCLLGSHLTDDLSDWGVPCPETEDLLEQRVASWKYQHEIVKSTPRPERFALVRYEDLVNDLDSSMRRLEDFLDLPLARIVVDGSRVGKWRRDPSVLPYLHPLADRMRELGYGD
jgi:hypothetical protein